MIGLDKHVIAKTTGVLFGIAFSVIGFVNMFWGNDPFFGVIIFAASTMKPAFTNGLLRAHFSISV